MPAEWLTGPQRHLTRFGETPRFKQGLYRLGQRSHAWMVPNGSWGETNIGLIDCGGQSVLIDTCWDLKCTQEVLDGARDILRDSPVEYVINTHADGDHCWGNQLFAGREIIASHACIQQMGHFKPASFKAVGQAGGLLRHTPLRMASQFGHYMNTMFKPYDFTDLRLLPARSGFSGEKVLNVRGTEIALFEVGPGHTDGDVIVYLPAENVLYAADTLFIDATPVAWAGPVENLVRSLRRLLEFKADIYVPGHGPLAQAEHIERLIQYWEFIQEALHQRLQRSMTPYEAARDVVLSPAFRDSPFRHWDSPERIVTNAFTLYRGWGAKLPSLPGVLSPMNILRWQAKLAFEMADASPQSMRRF